MANVYSAFLATLIPQMLLWWQPPTRFGTAYHGFLGRVLTLIAGGVFKNGVRDLVASLGVHE